MAVLPDRSLRKDAGQRLIIGARTLQTLRAKADIRKRPTKRLSLPLNTRLQGVSLSACYYTISCGNTSRQELSDPNECASTTYSALQLFIVC
jgi:hypothetical protein